MTNWIKEARGVYRGAVPPLPPADLPPDIYQHGATPMYHYLARHKVRRDKLIVTGAALVSDIMTECRDFWSPEVARRYAEHGFVHKRGFLLHSVPGIGKTSMIWQLADEVIAMNGVVLIAEGAHAAHCGAQLLRKLDPERPAMTIVEDFDNVTEDDVAPWLAILDGANSVGNMVYFVTTNNFPKIDKRFLRPSRFDRVIEMPPPTTHERVAFLKMKAPKMKRVEAAAEMTEGLTFAHLKELIVWTQCLGRDLDLGVKRLRELTI